MATGEAGGAVKVRLIYTTFPDLDTAKRIAGDLLDKRLVACANLFPGMVAVFRWEGKAEAEGEVAAVLKTAPDRVEALRAALLAAHPYDVPAFVALPEGEATEAFGGWVVEETRGG
jgi:periplasmic divalent cation tolerance protein